MYLTELFLIFLSVPLVWLWLDSMRVKEVARYRAAQICQRYQLQILDDTVHLTQLKVVHKQGRFRLKRRYGFEFTHNDGRRYSGYIVLINRQLVETYMDAYSIDDIGE